MPDIGNLLTISPVIPVVKLERPDHAVQFARCIDDAGISVIEITLRTSSALESIAAIKRDLPHMCVGAGTVWTEDQADAVIDAGVQFIVTPGRSDSVTEACMRSDVPLLPGAQTTSEVAHWLSAGLSAVKFFPASVAGGPAALKAFSAVFPTIQFCPTGGIHADNASDYLALTNVPCVGGSWLVDQAAIDQGDWEKIRVLAKEALALAG